MNLLLDTHVFLWLEEDPVRLSTKAEALIEADDATLWLSVASLWEIAIKQGLGKFSTNVTIGELLDVAINKDGIRILPIELRHLERLATLPSLHRDPFDRLLVAQALADSLTLLTADATVRAYPAATAW